MIKQNIVWKILILIKKNNIYTNENAFKEKKYSF